MHSRLTRVRARLAAWWQQRRRARWLHHYAQAVHWHTGYDRREARAIAEQVLALDPSAVDTREPTTAALDDMGIEAEDLA